MYILTHKCVCKYICTCVCIWSKWNEMKFESVSEDTNSWKTRKRLLPPKLNKKKWRKIMEKRAKGRAYTVKGGPFFQFNNKYLFVFFLFFSIKFLSTFFFSLLLMISVCVTVCVCVLYLYFYFCGWMSLKIKQFKLARKPQDQPS